MCSWGSSRAVIWSCWWIVNLVSIVYFALSFSSFNNVLKVYNLAKEGTGEILTILVSLAITCFMILLQGVLTFLLVLCKVALRSDAGFMYGFLTSSTGNLGFLVLMVSLICMGFQTEVQEVFEKDPGAWGLHWTSSETATFKFTYIFGFLTAILNMGFFSVKMAYSGTIGDPSTKEKIEQSIE